MLTHLAKWCVMLVPLSACVPARLGAEAKVENPFRSIKVIGVEATPLMIKVTVRNETSQNITAIEFASFAPSADTIATIDSDYGIEDTVLVPSASRVFNIDVVAGHPTSKVRIVAIVFEDGTGEGVPARLDFIKSNRVGRREQMRRIAPYWSSLLNTVQKGDAPTLGQLLNSILEAVSVLEETPAEEQDTPNRNVAAQQLGLISVKKEMVRHTQRLQERLAEGVPMEIMEKIIERYKGQFDAILAKLEKLG